MKSESLKEVLEKIVAEKADIVARLASLHSTYDDLNQEISHFADIIKEDEESKRRFDSMIEFLEKYIKAQEPPF